MIDILLLYLIITSIILITLTLITILNVFTFPRLEKSTHDVGARRAVPNSTSQLSQSSEWRTTEEYGTSILIPARNEAGVIAQTVTMLLSQTDDPNLEVIVLDDYSTDGTASVARKAAQAEPRLKVIGGKPLPEGWLGKPWACQQLAEAASSDVLIFSDADVKWEPGALDALTRYAHLTLADMVAVWPTQITQTWAERLAVPTMSMVIMAYLPLMATHHSGLAAFAAANGQCMLFRKAAYNAIGQHEAVRSEIVEDIMLAKHIVRSGFRLRVADGNRLIRCRMYENWPTVRDGFAKNIMAGYGENLFALFLGSAFHWAVFIGPYIAGAIGLFASQLNYVYWAAALIALGTGIRALTAGFTHQRPLDALLMPVSVLLMTIIAARSAYWYVRYGGPRWKDRTLPRWH